MSIRVTLTWGEAGVLAVKAALSPEQIHALADEAARLSRACHPGVVQLVEHRVTNDGAELRTEFAGEPLSRWRGTVARAVGLVAAVATTVADLHEIGVVHGRIDQTHVLLAADGRPRLCGFSAPPEDALPPDDVAALGQLLEELGERALKADRRGPGAFLWPRARVADHRALQQLVDHATEPQPTRRPTARALARSILAAFPHAELAAPDTEPIPAVTDLDPIDQPPPRHERPDDGLDARVTEVFGDQTAVSSEDLFVTRPWVDDVASPPAGVGFALGPRRSVAPRRSESRRRTPARRSLRPTGRLGVVAVIGLAAVAAGALALRASAPSDADAPEPADAPSPAPNRLCASAGQSGADVDGDGCAELVKVDGSEVEVAGERWTVGMPGDAVTVGDWDCDGVSTPAVYRPSTGDVFVFTRWAASGEPLAAQSVARIEGGLGLSTASSTPAGPGCDAPAVELAGGERHLVEVTP